ncbi:MAG: hypothetical protein IJ893_08680 [Bacteroidales bacterium]|jgi:hypothetical protein|nr:hypothetical protein [Bacteroidales bacterium]MBR2747162.1 hypothetical protein [Bacteroidales bacterium]
MKKPSTEKVIIVHRPQKPTNQEVAPTGSIATASETQSQAQDASQMQAPDQSGASSAKPQTK